MSPQIIEKMETFKQHFSGLLEAGCEILDLEGDTPRLTGMDSPGHFCSICRNCSELNTQLYGCHEAHRWNGRYTYYCPLGLVFVSSSVSDSSGKLIGGMIMGPMVMGEMQDSLRS
jgi:hypothetical protein